MLMSTLEPSVIRQLIVVAQALQVLASVTRLGEFTPIV
jgi:hypothetical protein